MKLYYIFIGVFLIVACDNELNIIEGKKDIPIVYGVLSSIDTAQYIRIERAFVDENTSALVLAKIADSLYYSSALVSIIDNSTGIEYTLEKVDAGLEGYPREDGVFAQSPNYLYKIISNNISLVSDHEYELVIKRNESLPEVKAATRLVGASQILTPSSSIGFAYVQPTKIRWRPGANARIFDISIEFNYRERVTSSSSGFERKSVTWNMAKNINSTGVEIEEFEQVGINFYSFLAGAITADPEIERRFDNISVILDSGGEEIFELNRLNDANLGITSSQDIPFYTNLSEGRGIFSSKYQEILPDLPLKSSSEDSLIMGIITKQLNFK